MGRSESEDKEATLNCNMLFSSSKSHYASPKGQSSYTIVDEDIWEFSRDGDVILLGDFNARTGHSQTVF